MLCGCVNRCTLWDRLKHTTAELERLDDCAVHDDEFMRRLWLHAHLEHTKARDAWFQHHALVDSHAKAARAQARAA